MSTLTVTLIQTALHWENIGANLQMLEEKIRAIPERTELIILPEMFSTGFSMNASALAEKMDGRTISWMKAIASERKVIITGSVIIGEEGNYYNRLVWMLPNGQSGYYDKRHLFVYAGEHKSYAAGTRRLIASVKGWKINLLVCYDLRFPVWSRQQCKSGADNIGEEGVGENAGNLTAVDAEYDILVYVANWPERRNHAWKSLLPARAIENQAFVIGVNRVGEDGNGIKYSGDSMIVDPLGETIYHKAEDEDVHTFTFHKEKLQETRSRFPFLNDADAFTIR